MVRVGLIVVLVIAGVLRLGFALTRSSDEQSLAALPDQLEYVELARSVLDGRGLELSDARFGDLVYAHRTPGYPLFVAGLGANVTAVRVAQCMIDVSSVFATFLLARRWMSSRWALLAAALVAIQPFLIYFSSLLLTETIFTAMLAWSLVLLTIDRSHRLARIGWFAGVLLLAVSVLVRPSAAGLPGLMGVASMFAGGTALLPPRYWPPPAGATAPLITALVLLPWAYRNHGAVGAWVWTSSNDGLTLYDGLHPGADGSSDQSFVRDMPQLPRMSEVERSRYLRQLAIDQIRSDPRRFARLAVRKVLRTWSPIPLSEEYRSRRLYVLVAAAYAAPVMILAIVAIMRVPIGARNVLLLALPALYFTLVHAVSVGSLRYRVPVEPQLAILAAMGAAVVIGRTGQHRRDEERALERATD